MDYMDHGVLQARILEWVAFSFSRGFPQPRDGTQVSHIVCGFFTSRATREVQEYFYQLSHKGSWKTAVIIRSTFCPLLVRYLLYAL